MNATSADDPGRAGVTAAPTSGAPESRAGTVCRVNCFTPGTVIATPSGGRPVEDLLAGDRVLTRDNGPQTLRWIGRKSVTGPPLRLDTRLQPILIRAGALGPGVPDRDLLVSPNHRVLLLGDHPALDTAEAEVFVSARHLVGTRGIERVQPGQVTYLHVMCDRHEVVLSNGAWTESFQPCDTALAGVTDRAREELLALFPALAETGEPGFPAARKTASDLRFRA